MRTRAFSIVLALAFVVAGCGKGKQTDFPDLHPVKGVVTKGSQKVNGGVIEFTPESGEGQFLINSEVDAGGNFTLSTVPSQGKDVERKPGAPAGTYKVTYRPAMGDQASGGSMDPISIPGTVTVKAGDNNTPIDLLKK